jgi:uncharacterized protein YcsI (UPF0317 family)
MASTALSTGHAVRLAARAKTLSAQTSGLTPSYLQANLIVLPEKYANDFRLLCQRNPVPCPLLAESARPGAFSLLSSRLYGPSNGTTALEVARDIDLRHDAPQYLVYQDGVPIADDDTITDLTAHWQPDHVRFLIGCSYSFEEALASAGLPPRHTTQGRNVPMYRTKIPLCPAGVFTGSTYVVSMRPYRMTDIPRVREITSRFVATHGEPIPWGWDGAEKLGIVDIAKPEWGDAPLSEDGKDVFCRGGDDDGFVPVFWGCGVTPQEAVMRAGLEGTVMGHKPGHMIVLDVKEDEVFGV